MNDKGFYRALLFKVMSIIKQVFSSNAHWQINKEFARAFGIDAALIMTDLTDKWLYHKQKEWFFNTANDIENDTTLSNYRQNKALNLLEEKGFIKRKLMGIPAKVHFSICENNLLKFFDNSYEIFSEQDLKKFQNYINKNKPDKNKPNKNKVVRAKKILVNGFNAPTKDEVKKYMDKRGFKFDLNKFMMYYPDEKGVWRDKNGKGIVSWKHCCITWHSDDYIEQAIITDFDKKCQAVRDGEIDSIKAFKNYKENKTVENAAIMWNTFALNNGFIFKETLERWDATNFQNRLKESDFNLPNILIALKDIPSDQKKYYTFDSLIKNENNYKKLLV